MSASGELPVVLLIFNRPEKTLRCLEHLRQARPPELFVVADGPRSGHPSDAERCTATRACLDRVDWPCRVHRLFRNENLGCRQSVSSGLNWAFEAVSQAVIIEDDCLVDPSFFPFARTVLERFGTQARLGSICAMNVLGPKAPQEVSYFFSRFNLCWGWATTRKAWNHYDASMSAWPELRGSSWLKELGLTPVEQHYWRTLFDDAHDSRPGSLDSWAVIWMYSCWRQRLCHAIPHTNLVCNVGFDAESTHTGGLGHTEQPPMLPMEEPITHPDRMVWNDRADTRMAPRLYHARNWWERVYWSLRLPLRVSTVRCWSHRLRKIANPTPLA